MAEPKKRKSHGLLFLLLVVLLVIFGYQQREKLTEWFPVLAQFTETTKSKITGLPSQPKAVESVSDGKYAYSCLSDEDKLVYDQVYDAILNRKTNVPVSTLNSEALTQIYTCVMADYPGLFWVNGFAYETFTKSNVVTSMTFTPKFTMTEDEQKSYQASVDSVVDGWLSDISLEASDYDKALFVFQKVIDKTTYNTESENNQNILSVFLNGESVCQGYADSVSYLLQNLGIQSTVITGTANGISHAWNLVYLDGAYYYIDATWGDGYYTDANIQKTANTNYAYLNTTTEHMNKTHTPDSIYQLPECTATQDSYFVKNGLYFTGFDGSAMGAIIQDAYQKGQGSISMQFQNENLYEKTKDYFLVKGNVRKYVSADKIQYLERREDLVLTINF